MNYKDGLGSSKVYVMDNEMLPSLYYLPWSKKPHQTHCLMSNNNNNNNNNNKNKNNHNNHHNDNDYQEDDGNYETKGSPTKGHEHHKNILFPKCLRQTNLSSSVLGGANDAEEGLQIHNTFLIDDIKHPESVPQGLELLRQR